MSPKKSSSKGKEKINIGTDTNTDSNTSFTTLSLVITNLRLLEIEKRDDWPKASEQTFLTLDWTQIRVENIRFTEWILYRLFEIWDADLTKEVSNIYSGSLLKRKRKCFGCLL